MVVVQWSRQGGAFGNTWFECAVLLVIPFAEMAGETMEFEVKGGLLSRAARYWKMGSASSRKGLPLLLASPLSPNEWVVFRFPQSFAWLSQHSRPKFSPARPYRVEWFYRRGHLAFLYFGWHGLVTRFRSIGINYRLKTAFLELS